MSSDQIRLDDILAIDDTLSDEERLVRDTTRRYVREAFLPIVQEHFENATFPHEIIPQLGELGLFGANIHGYGCAGMNNVSYGLALQELEYGDSGLRSFVSVQGALCMYPIHRFGSDEQKNKWLPKMATGEVIGCFGLTEPGAGSDPGGMTTRARKDGNEWVISGQKMWITNSSISHLCVVWAKTDGDDAKGIRGFLVERDRKGLTCPQTHHKMSLRASVTGEIVLDEVRVPADHMLPGSSGLGSALACLNQARFGIAFGAVGAARACLEEAIAYAKERIVFGKPIAGKQLIQKQIVDAATQIALGQWMVLHLARIKDKKDGAISPYQVSMAKRNNCEMALRVARDCRSILGGNGISAEFAAIRHMLNLESVYTYEGTHEVHTLILGRGLTGEDAF